MEEQTAPQKKRSMNPLVIVVVVLLLAGGGWLVFSKSKEASTNQQPAPSTAMEQMSGDDMKESPTSAAMQDTSVSPEANESGVKEIVVEGKNFAFSPSMISVKKGDKVKITFKNIGGFHNLTIDYNGKEIATKTIQTDQSDSIEFVADKAGMYDFYCSVGNHRQMGMAGKLSVE